VTVSSSATCVGTHRRHKRAREETNKWIAFADGIISGFSGQDHLINTIKGCIDEIQGIEKPPQETSSDLPPLPTQTMGSKILGLVAKISIKTLCRFQGEILKYLGPLIRRRQYSLVQKRFNGPIRKILQRSNSVTPKSKTTDDIQAPKKKLLPFGKKPAATTDNADDVQGVSEKVKAIYGTVKGKITDWAQKITNSKLYIMFQKIIKSDCFATATALYRIVQQIIKVTLFITKMVASHGAGLGIAIPKIVIGLLCKWQDIVRIVRTFSLARTSTGADKYYRYGLGTGKIFSLIISVLRRRRARRLH